MQIPYSPGDMVVSTGPLWGMLAQHFGVVGFPETLEKSFSGKMGLACDASGVVTEVFKDGQAHALGIEIWYRITSIAGAPYSATCLGSEEESSLPYRVTFEVPQIIHLLGGEPAIVKQDVSYRNWPTGTVIVRAGPWKVVSSHGEEAARLAEGALSNQEAWKYNKRSCNCEHLARWCCTGRFESLQISTIQEDVDDWISENFRNGVMFKLEYVERNISRRYPRTCYVLGNLAPPGMRAVYVNGIVKMRERHRRML